MQAGEVIARFWPSAVSIVVDGACASAVEARALARWHVSPRLEGLKLSPRPHVDRDTTSAPQRLARLCGRRLERSDLDGRGPLARAIRQLARPRARVVIRKAEPGAV